MIYRIISIIAYTIGIIFWIVFICTLIKIIYEEIKDRKKNE